MKERVYSKDVILVMIASFFYMFNAMMVIPLIAGFTGSLGGSAELMGFVGGLMTICSMICRPVAGNLADRMKKAHLSSIGCVLMAVSSLGYFLAQGPALIIVSRIINGIGYACCSVCMSTWVSSMLPPEKLGSGMGMYGVVIALSNAAAPFLGLTLYEHFGYRTSFMVSIFFSVVALIIMRIVKDKGEPQAPAVLPAGEQKPRLQIVDRNAVPVALIVLLFALPYCATQSFLESYAAARQLGIKVSLYFPVYAGVLLTLRIVLKKLFDRLPFHIFVIIGSVSAVFSMIFLTVMKTNWQMFLAAFFMASGYGLTYTVCQATAITRAGAGRRGVANSTFFLGLDLALSLGPILGGIFYGNLPVEMFYPMFMITVPILLIVLLFGERSYKRVCEKRSIE